MKKGLVELKKEGNNLGEVTYIAQRAKVCIYCFLITTS